MVETVAAACPRSPVPSQAVIIRCAGGGDVGWGIERARAATVGGGAQRAVRMGPAVEAEAMGPSVSWHLIIVLCRVEQAAVTRDGTAKGREGRLSGGRSGEERDTLAGDESAKHVSQIRH